MAWNSTDLSFKTLINRQTTDANKAYYEELGDLTINTAMREIWIDPLPSNPAIGITNGIVQQYTLFVLTEDTSVPAQQAYNDGGLKNWISPKYGALYTVHLYDNANNEIFPTDASQWFFNYQTGILTFNGSTASFAKPFKITGYRYIGNIGKVVTDLATAGTNGLQVNYSDGSVNFLPIQATGGGISGPLSGLKAEYVYLNLTASVPSIIDYSALLFNNVAAVQFYSLEEAAGTSGTAGVLDLALLDVRIDSNTTSIILNSDINVQGFVNIVGEGDITLIGNISNATTTQRGVVEIATQTEFNNSTDVGGSGAMLMTPVSMIKGAIAAVDFLTLPPPMNSFDPTGAIGNWSYDAQFIYYCTPCVGGTAGTCGAGKIWRRIAIEEF